MLSRIISKLSLSTDETKIRRTAVKKVTEFYQEVAWGSVSSILDHVVLWWSPEALAARHSHGSQHLKDWLHQFIQGNDGMLFRFMNFRIPWILLMLVIRVKLKIYTIELFILSVIIKKHIRISNYLFCIL